MRRLEVLVDLLLLSTFENAAERWDDLALAEADRQMFSAAAALADLAVAGLADPTPAAALAGAPDRQTFSAATPAGMEGAGTTVKAAATTGIRKIRFTAPEPIARHWQGAIAAIQEEPGGRKPVWLCVLKLLRDAVETWHTHDPETIPT